MSEVETATVETETPAETTTETAGTEAAETGTIAESDGDAAVATPADWPPDWRERMAGDDTKLLQLLQRRKTPADVAKSWREWQAKISAAKPEKPTGDDPEALNKWRASVGLPTEPDGYLEKTEGLVIGDEDKEIVGSFLQTMHAKDAPPELVREALEWHQKLKEDIIVKQVEADKTRRGENEDALRQEWGQEFRPNLNGMHSLIDQYSDDPELKSRIFSARYPDGSLIGDDPGFLKMMVGLSREINPHGTITPSSGQSMTQALDDEIGTIKGMMADTKSEYWKGPKSEKYQSRYRELLELKDKLGKRA